MERVMTDTEEEDLFGAAGSFQVTEPGRYDMPDPTYHADPVPDPGSLSSTGARTILKSPKKFAWTRRFGSGPKTVFDVGSAAHRLVLGTGPELVKITGNGADENAWRTNDDRAAVKAAREAGKIPLNPINWVIVHDMAEALAAKSEIAELLTDGTAEEAFFAVEPRTKMWIRGKTDYRHADRSVIDYKTSSKPVDPDTFARTMASFGYHVQFAFYKMLLMILGLIDSRSDFVAIAQEKDPPYDAAVLRPDADAMAYGHAEALLAVETFQRCVLADEWPGYPSEPQEVALPGWKLRDYETRGIEPVYTDRVGLALGRIATCENRTELNGIMIAFGDVKAHPDVRQAANDMWAELGRRSA
jgi:hypothetical protein